MLQRCILRKITSFLKSTKNLCFLTIVFILPSLAHSAAIGLPTSTARFGLGTNISQLSFKDDVGRTRSVFSSQPTSIYFTDWLHKDIRHLTEVHISNYAFEADASHSGLELKQFGLRFSAQVNTPIYKKFRPWSGVGLNFSYSQLKKRHTVDSDGFLLQRYEDQSTPSISILLNIMEKWTINSDLDVAAKLEYSLPVSQAVNGVTASVLFLFKPIQ